MHELARCSLRLWGEISQQNFQQLAISIADHADYSVDQITHEFDLETPIFTFEHQEITSMPTSLSEDIRKAGLSYSWITEETPGISTEIQLFHAPSGETSTFDLSREEIVVPVAELKDPSSDRVKSAIRTDRRFEAGRELGLIITTTAHEKFDARENNIHLAAYLDDTSNGD